ncbi:amino acid adenylation domain-containing protein [Yersinia ruckeri]|nr:amino acid adenylation domain-containing protein [Yersinia ruckeri]
MSEVSTLTFSAVTESEFPLVAAQPGIWFADQISVQHSAYAVAHYIELRGSLDIEHFQLALRQGLAEADTVQARFGLGDLGPVQWLSQGVDPQQILPAECLDLRDQPDPIESARRLMAADLVAGESVAAGQLQGYRQILIRVNPAADQPQDGECWLWYQRYHHLMLDGFSFTALTRRIAEIYTARLAGGSAGNNPFTAFSEVVAEYLAYQGSVAEEKDRQFWLQHAAALPVPVCLAVPGKNADEAGLSPLPLRHHFHVDPAQFSAIVDIAKSQRLSEPEIAVAVVLSYLYRLSGQSHLSVGFPFMRRIGSVAIDALGPVVNVLPLQARMQDDLTLVEVAQRVALELKALRRHQRYEADQLRRDLGLVGAGQDLYGPTINFKLFEYQLDFAGISGITHQMASGPVEDLEFNLYLDEGKLSIELTANPARYTEQALVLHGNRLRLLIQQVSADLQRPLAALQILPDGEMAQLQQWGQGAKWPVPAGVMTLLDILHQQVLRQPQAIALECNGHSLSFAELEARALQYASLLNDLGVGRQHVVAVALPRNEEALVVLLGILAAGAVYLPLDVDYPLERLNMMCADAAPIVLITCQSLLAQLPTVAKTLCVDHPDFCTMLSDASPCQVNHHPEMLAYIIYTSGSTGRPKGVMNTHGGLVNLLLSHQRSMIPAAEQQRLRVGHSTSFSFDAAWDPLIWMLLGHQLHIFSDLQRQDAQTLVAAVREQQIDVLDLTPLFLQQLLDAGLIDKAFHQPRILAVGGEAISTALWQRLRQQPDLQVFNLYGPTECTVDSLQASIRRSSTPVIGQPIANMQAWVLDRQLNLLPIGVAGELYLSGAGLARGYLHRPDLTAARFIANPHANGQLMYRSGDRVCWRDDGQLDFLGRTDNQIKVRGFRVELEEVENALLQLPQVMAAAVIAEPLAGSYRLLGYCALTSAWDDHDVLAQQLRRQLSERLPEYMVPATLMLLEQLPLNINGKVDKTALPSARWSTVGAGRAADTPQEKIVCAAIAEVLHLDSVSADDDFFQLGGDSISAMALGSYLRRHKYRLAPREIFALRTPAVMAEALQPLAQTAVSYQEYTRSLPPQLMAAAQAKYGSVAEILPVLPLQQGLLFHAQLGQEANNYNAISRFELLGELDVAQLRRALASLLVRYPQLAAIFDTELHREPLQILPQIDPAQINVPWREMDLSALTDKQQLAEFHRLETSLLAKDLIAGTPQPLLEAVLVRYAAEQHTLLIVAHHLIGDGWSSSIILHDLLHSYAQQPLPPLKVSYGSLINQMTQRDLQQDRQIWQQAMQGVMPLILHPDADSAGPVRELAIELDSELEAGLLALQRREGLTLNTLLQGVWGTLLGALTGRNDVVFGSPVSGRFSAVEGIDQHVGLFSNTLPVRVTLQPDLPLLPQLSALQQRQIELLEHDGLGLGEIQRLVAANTLFDTLLVVENYPENSELHQRAFGGLRCASLNNRGYTHYPLTLLALPGEKLQLQLEYRDAVKDPQRVAQRVIMLLESLIRQPERPLAALDLQTADEKALLAEINRTGIELPALTLCDLMAEQARKTPQAIALLDSREQMNYRQMRERVTALAAYLQRQGVQAGDRVAVALPRSVNLSLSLMAILAAGAAYLPLDTGYPDDRLAYMIQDAQPRLIITLSELAPRFADHGSLLLLDQLTQPWPVATAFTAPLISPHHPAYLIYTSGSTGRPKGVVVSHGAIVNRLLWMQNAYPLGSDDVVLQKTPCSFDVSVWEFFWPMITGARLVMAPPEAHRDPEVLRAIMEDYRVTTAHFVPSMLAAFVSAMHGQDRPCMSLRRVFCSGEALSRELSALYQQIFAAPLHNLYGPTEAAVDVTYQPASGADLARVMGSSVPIGKPVWNTQLRILDHLLRPVPMGVAGDLYLCGVQLAQGYYARPDLTASRFVADPFAVGQRMYRTGDIACWLANGEVEYLGRSDDQLKIRGQRIELGEIESAMLERPEVQQAVVVARTWGTDDGALAGADSRQLVGYIVPAGQPTVDTDALRTALAERLPAHMVPVVIISLNAFPLSANGKLDRKALPAPVSRSNDGGRAPAAGLERLIATLFARLLSIESVSADTDFFASGGHSLLAMRLAADLRRELKQPVAVGQVMVASTVASLAAALRQPKSIQSQNDIGFAEVMTLRQGQGHPLFCLHPASGFSWQFSQLPRYLAGKWPVLGLQSPRPGGAIAECSDMDAVCEHHLMTLRRIQPQGPYHLMGYSLGGTIAQGIAVKLQELGEEVAFLGLLDTYPPETQDWHAPIEAEALAEVAREREVFMAVAGDEQEERRNMFEQIQANYDDAVGLLSAATTAVYHGETTLFVATQTQPEGDTPAAIWAPYVKNLRTYPLDCSHITMMSPDTLKVLGPLLDQLLGDIGSLGQGG